MEVHTVSSAIGEGVSEVGNLLLQFGNQIFQADAARQTTDALSEAYQRFADIDSNLRKNLDYTTWDDTFKSGSDTAYSEIAAKIKNPQAKKNFESQFLRIKADQYSRVSADARQKLLESAAVSFESSVKDARARGDIPALDAAISTNAGITVDKAWALALGADARRGIERDNYLGGIRSQAMSKVAAGEDPSAYLASLLNAPSAEPGAPPGAGPQPGAVPQQAPLSISEYNTLVADCNAQAQAARAIAEDKFHKLDKGWRDAKGPLASLPGTVRANEREAIMTTPDAYRPSLLDETFNRDKIAALSEDYGNPILKTLGMIDALESDYENRVYGTNQELRDKHLTELRSQLAYLTAKDKPDKDTRTNVVNSQFEAIRIDGTTNPNHRGAAVLQAMKLLNNNQDLAVSGTFRSVMTDLLGTSSDPGYSDILQNLSKRFAKGTPQSDIDAAVINLTEYMQKGEGGKPATLDGAQKRAQQVHDLLSAEQFKPWRVPKFEGEDNLWKAQAAISRGELAAAVNYPEGVGGKATFLPGFEASANAVYAKEQADFAKLAPKLGIKDKDYVPAVSDSGYQTFSVIKGKDKAGKDIVETYRFVEGDRAGEMKLVVDSNGVTKDTGQTIKSPSLARADQTRTEVIANAQKVDVPAQKLETRDEAARNLIMSLNDPSAFAAQAKKSFDTGVLTQEDVLKLARNKATTDAVKKLMGWK